MTSIEMAKVEDYKIISYNNHVRVQKEVVGLRNQGYQPWGELSVVVSPVSNTPIFTQAMVKYDALWNDT